MPEGNPITSMMRSMMESQKERDAKFIHRIGESSVDSQKVVDERSGPTRADMFWRSDPRSRGNDHFYFAHSSYKGKPEGCVSSYKAYRYYSDKAAERRDALLAKAKAEEGA
uniref:Uncharacterized protein n=1 Tax=Trieres chinensis TaxID=1514140 RepID=A0A7S1Z7P8_TRICV|mmetsp:Transcript_19176/g.38876  ORF Transcript_19176/g.38876 Transcript_19176/m.38876 type:complete len:111 (+) Transcript_19176:81-413(+)|eukprot:CAMPEP_0183296554 /NCGR_PEP_ID=MMETSP0160_2-20130417/4056_1 /TAXON_ID=2839 ORGANISM="Odontella Sinensis, Strain Grunow 1884" /NCGR_SAMPLE_ID=MMETSP0160_2 /ASSEMBLY_ACC=CAM_ASM_000250 /LENGTH=110 /DNA_ID=CAMNT_0025458175 /DNA_START=78 /DNA_END=410 /DNA_ORIENTATION=-